MLSNLTIPPFTVAGVISSGIFQKVSDIAKKCEASASATIMPLLPVEYAKLLVKLQAQFGGPAYMHTAGVVVFSDIAGFIGDDAQFTTWLGRNNVMVPQPTGKPMWDKLAKREYETLIGESGRTFAYVELSTQKEGPIGRLTFELFPDLAPNTCDNFFKLCENGYVSTPIHRVKRGAWMQGGDPSGNGDGGKAASGSAIADESFHLKHSENGLLGMVNNGAPHTATSQFYVTFAPCPCFDGQYVAFGTLVDGAPLLQFLEEVEVINERPTRSVFISAAGKVVAAEGTGSLLYDNEDEAAQMLQGMHKARLQQREFQERKAAAKRIAAAKKGRDARRQVKQEKEAAVKVQAMTRGRNARKAKA